MTVVMLSKSKESHDFSHGSMSTEERQKALAEWNDFLVSVIEKVKPDLYEKIFIKV